MAMDQPKQNRGRLGFFTSLGIILWAAISGLLVFHQVSVNPWTDDAEVFANYIGMAPVVSGPVTNLYVVDNQLVKEGESLFEIDRRPYAYALARAQSDQKTLKG